MINEYALNVAIRTLILMSISGGLVAVLLFVLKPIAVLSTTMCEEKKALKERLGAIMKSACTF